MNIVSPLGEIFQLRQSPAISLHHCVEKIGLIPIPYDRRFQIKLDPHTVELAGTPLELTHQLAERAGRWISAYASGPRPHIAAQ